MITQAITVTELRRNLLHYLGRVEAGESFLVTVHSKAIARLSPEMDSAEAAYQKILSYRSQSWVGDVITPLDEK